MSGKHSTHDPASPNTADAFRDQVRHDEPMDDEEKVIANRLDANIPALLTRDVLGG